MVANKKKEKKKKKSKGQHYKWIQYYGVIVVMANPKEIEIDYFKLCCDELQVH